MILVRKEGKFWEVKSTADEVTIGEFQKINDILVDESIGSTNKRIEILKVVGLPNEIANDLSYKSLLDVSKQVMQEEMSGELTLSITVSDEVYNLIGGKDFDLTASDVAKIENVFTSKEDNYIAKIVAICYGVKGSKDNLEAINNVVPSSVALPLIIECEQLILGAVNEVLEIHRD